MPDHICLIVVAQLAAAATADAAPKKAPKIQPTPVEHGAILDEAMTPAIIDASAAFVRAHGWKCDNISSALPMMWRPGLTLKCNGFRYECQIEDRGGQWQAKLAD